MRYIDSTYNYIYRKDLMLSQEQKTDIGNRFIDEINRRIKTRKELQEKANTEYKEIVESFESAKEKFAKDSAKKHNISGKITDYSLHYGGEKFNISTELIKLSINITEFTFKKYDTTEIVKKRSEICKEIEFLHCLLGHVGGFQSYVSKLVCPKTKTEKIPDSDLKPYIQGYIDARRPVVCNL